MLHTLAGYRESSARRPETAKTRVEAGSRSLRLGEQCSRNPAAFSERVLLEQNTVSEAQTP